MARRRSQASPALWLVNLVLAGLLLGVLNHYFGFGNYLAGALHFGSGKDYSEVACADGTTVSSSLRQRNSPDQHNPYFNPGNGYRILACDVPDGTGDQRNSPPVGSLISGDLLAMVRAAADDDIIITWGQGLRTYEEQQYFYDCFQSQDCNYGNSAAEPGKSAHELGTAIDVYNCDWGSRVRQWLDENAANFNFRPLNKNSGDEPWHWTSTRL